MKDAAFQELLSSIRQAGRIRRGRLKPMRVRVAPAWEPDRPQRGPYTGRGTRTVELIGDRACYSPIFTAHSFV